MLLICHLMASIDGESLELEVKHKDTGSWHPCCVSLSSGDSKVGLVIDFKNSNEEDLISYREDALERLRFRSTPLQDDECSHIKEGDTVLAMYEDKFRKMFFDAVIEKLRTVKHSKRLSCRCTFDIKWLNAVPNEETVNIKSNSIMRLSTKEIDSHPICSSFLNAFSPNLEEEKSQADLARMLERQIEEISKLADGPMDSSSDLFEVSRFKFGGGKQSKSALTSYVTSVDNRNGFRRSSRSQSKEQLEVKLTKELDDDKPLLTPLAARAAFASLIHEQELPLKKELSLSMFERDGQDGDDNMRIESKGTSRRSNQKGTPRNTKAKVCLLKEATEESGDDTWSTAVNKSPDSKKVAKTSARSLTTRLTRSSANKEIEGLSNEPMEASSMVSTRRTLASVQDKGEQVAFKVISPVSTTRLTRSGNQKEHRNSSIDEDELIQDKNVTPDESESKQGSSVTAVYNPIDSKTAGNLRGRITRSSVHKQHEASPEPGSSVKKILSTTARFTRSRLQKEENNGAAGTEPEVSKDATPRQDDKKRSSISSLVTDAWNKRTKASHGAIDITENSGATDTSMEDDKNVTAEKKTGRKKATSAQKPPLRSSPRFSSLPRTSP